MTPPGVHRGWGIVGALGVVVLVGVLVLWARTPRPADPAQGSVTRGLVLSTDRVHWSATLDEPLFDPDQPWSPGQTGSRDVYVRNDGATASGVQVSVGTHGGDRADGGWAVVSARAEGQGWTSLQQPGSTLLLRDLSLGPGEVQTIQLRAMVDSAASAEAMGRKLDIDVDVRPDGALSERTDSSRNLWPRADLLAKSVTAAAGGLLALLVLSVVRHRRAEAGT
jgi:hypothetical protein